MSAAPREPGRVRLAATDDGPEVRIGGELFATYRTNPDHMPSVWPIVGPHGREATRSYPLGPARPHEAKDHPHHLSLWFTHQGVNGHDFWHTPEATYGPSHVPNPGNRIVHREYLRSEVVDDGVAVIATRNDWIADDGSRQLQDVRSLAFGETDDADPARYIDFSIQLKAVDGDVVINDMKDGAFAIRVAGPMKVQAGFGGGFVNDLGQTDAAAWGLPARWVDYHGPVEVDGDGEPLASGGVVMMSHPESFRPQCRWHVREYGLFTANPFGDREFPPITSPQGAVNLEQGDDVELRYRAVFYADSASAEQIEAWFDRFAATPLRYYTAELGAVD